MTGPYLDKGHPEETQRRLRDLEARVLKLEAERVRAIAASSKPVRVVDPRETLRDRLWADAAEAAIMGRRPPL